MSDRQATIDIEALRALMQLVGDDKTVLASLIEDFLGIGPQLAADMRGALQKADADGLRIAAHTLKSNARDFGCNALSDTCREIENAARAGDLAPAAPLVGTAEALTAQNIGFLRELDLSTL